MKSGTVVADQNTPEQVNRSSAQIEDQEEDFDIDSELDDILGTNPLQLEFDFSQEEEKEVEEPFLNYGLSVLLGLGYKTNIYSSTTLEKNDYYLFTQFDLFVFKDLNVTESFYFYLSAESYNYSTIDAADDEGTIYLQVNGPFFKSDIIIPGLRLDVFVQQYLDTTNDSYTPESLSLVNGEIKISPYCIINFKSQYSLILETFALKNTTTKSEKDYSGLGISSVLKFKYGRRNTFSFNLSSSENTYQDAEVYNLEETAITGSQLKIKSRSLALEQIHYWQSIRGLVSETEVSITTNRDNGPGYDHYNKSIFTESIKTSNNGLQLEADFNIAHDEYLERPVSSSSEVKLGIILFTIQASMENKISSHTTLITKGSYTYSNSNDPDENYTTSSLTIGGKISF